MNWEDLHYLETTVRCAGVPAGARELGVAASTVYRRLAIFEEALGCSVLHKGVSPPRLTVIGEELIAIATQARTGLARAERLARQSTKEVAGRVSLTTVEAMVPELVQPLLALRQEHPELSIQLILSESGPSVKRHEVDLSIGVMPNPPRSLLFRRLFRINFGVFGTKEAIAREPMEWVISGPPIHNTPEADWERATAQKVILESGSRMTSLAMIRAGLGVAMLPSRLAKPHPELIEVTKFQPELALVEPRYTYLIIQPERKDDANISAVVNLLTQWFAEDPAAI